MNRIYAILTNLMSCRGVGGGGKQLEASNEISVTDSNNGILRI